MKKTALIILFIMLFTFSVSADDTETFYNEQYEISGADALYEALPQEVREYMQENNITAKNSDFINNMTAENVFSHIWGFLKSGARAPIKASIGIIGIILISAAISSLDIKGSAASAALYATALCAAAIISAPVFSCIKAGVNTMQGSAVFMTAFIPVFAGIVAASGGVATSVSMSTLLLAAVQGVNYIASFVVVPLMSGYMAISLTSCVSPLIQKTGIADGIKKLGFWIMSLTTTVFIGILSIQTTVNASADTLTTKTAKFIIGSSVPVAGTALSEALTTVTASMGLLKASVGIYAVLAVVICFLPILAELLIWRVALIINSCISDLFSLPKISALLRSVDTVMSVLLGILLLTGAMFIISISVVVSSGVK